MTLTEIVCVLHEIPVVDLYHKVVLCNQSLYHNEALVIVLFSLPAGNLVITVHVVKHATSC